MSDSISRESLISNSTNKSNIGKYIVVVLFPLFVVWVFSAKIMRNNLWATDDFIFINDIHIDYLYDPHAPSSTLCRNSTNHSYTKKYARYGCDSSLFLYESMLKYIKSSLRKPFMIVFGGDSISYWNFLNSSQLQNHFRWVMDSLGQLYSNTPVIPVLGNNEFIPNYGNYESDRDNFRNIAGSLSNILSNDELSTFNIGGYYFRDFKERNLRIIVLNSIAMIKDRNYNVSITDPHGQLEWFEKQCENGSNLGLNIGVVMHIPTGVTFWQGPKVWHSRFSDKFNSIVSKYEISFILSAHSHTDLLLPVFNNNNSWSHISLVSPSLSPSHNNNPGFRLYKMKNGKIIDYTQYIADISRVNQEIKWEIEYSFRSAYQVDDLAFPNIGKAINMLKAKRHEMFKYLQRVMAGVPNDDSYFYCLLSANNQTEYSKCQSMMYRSFNDVY